MRVALFILLTDMKAIVDCRCVVCRCCVQQAARRRHKGSTTLGVFSLRARIALSALDQGPVLQCTGHCDVCDIRDGTL